MKKNNLTLITILTVFLLLSLCPISFSETNKTSIQDIIKSVESIQEYQVNLTAKIFPPDVYDLDPNAPDDFDPNRFIESNSIVYGVSGKKMKIITTTKVPELNLEMGTNNLTISAMKIHIPSVSPDPINDPFNTIYGVAGIGLFMYSDLPGTFMKLIENYSLVKDPNKLNSKYIVFSGNLIAEKQISKPMAIDKEIGDFMDNRTSFCRILVSKNNGLIEAYSLGNSEKRPTLNTEIKYVIVNQKLPDDTFIYVPPEGVVVRDITSDVLKYMENN